MRTLIVSACLLASAILGRATAQQTPEDTARVWLDRQEDYLRRIATMLWLNPEPAHHELASSALLRSELTSAGFTVEVGIAGLPTAFIASAGSGRPVIGIVALLDALPGLPPGPAGHGCGHNLIGAADLGAVVAIRRALAAHDIAGTIRFYGAPAEEIYHGGVYMVREGVFDDLDALLFWHPSSVTTVIGRSGLAMDSVRYVFEGRASDATDAADKGRNALEAAETLASAVKVVEQNWPADTVVNHVLLHGGEIPSVVPSQASLWYFLHGPDRNTVETMRSEISGMAKDAADATGTSVERQLLSSTRRWLINRRMATLLQRELAATGDPSYSEEERSLARELRAPFESEGDVFFQGVLPLDFSEKPVPISDDTADASWVTPRGGFLVACFPAGVPSHTRAWARAAGSSFALQGMMRAARALTATALTLYTDQATLASIREEFQETVRDAPYQSPLPRERRPFDFLELPSPAGVEPRN